MEYRCAKCGFRIKTLFVQSSPGNIRLMKCENCMAIVDEYIECEIMILLIDLILQKRQAYRHLLYNVLNRETVNLEILKHVVFGNIMFLGIFLLTSRILSNMLGGVSRIKDFLVAVRISSDFKILIVAMMVWKFPSSVIFIIDLLVLASNAVALKGLANRHEWYKQKIF